VKAPSFDELRLEIIDIDPGRNYVLWWRGHRVGYANFFANVNGSYELCDIRVTNLREEEQQRIRYALNSGPLSWGMNWRQILRSVFSPMPVTLRQGYGPRLLQAAFHDLKSLGVTSVFGRVVHRDLKERPWLPGWYESQGFGVKEDSDGTFALNKVL
jgi:hypothetical protein